MNNYIDQELWDKSLKKAKLSLDDMKTFGSRESALTILQLALYNFAMQDRNIKEAE